MKRTTILTTSVSLIELLSALGSHAMEFNISSSRILLSTKNSIFPHSHDHLRNQPDQYVEFSAMAHILPYFIIGAWAVFMRCLIVKCAGACDPAAESNSTEDYASAAIETEPIVQRKEMASTYGTKEEDPELGLCCSSEDLYDGKICVICYDAGRNCFFTPCGHSVACTPCARRIMEEENKLCPVCRRLIHKVRTLRSV